MWLCQCHCIKSSLDLSSIPRLWPEKQAHQPARLFTNTKVERFSLHLNEQSPVNILKDFHEGFFMICKVKKGGESHFIVLYQTINHSEPLE